jgi:Fe-Mn family superoxide dismutase
LAKAIEAAFGSVDDFKAEFNKAAVSVFGSGWAWLVKDAEGKLSITKESNAGNPLTSGLTPLLTFDVWEHAYYIDYQNRRADYVAALWDLVDWNVVSARY